jgi:hypothetical protein
LPMKLQAKTSMSRLLKDISLSELEKLPGTSNRHGNMGEELIRLHLWNEKMMHWYLSEYSPINRKFFGYFENSNDTISSGLYTLRGILIYGKKGKDWKPFVDASRKPIVAKDIPKLRAYIEIARNGTYDLLD